MSSEKRPPIRQRRRVLDIDEPKAPVETVRDVFDPGPMVHYPPIPVGPDGLPRPPEVRQRIRDLRSNDQRAAKDFILRTLHTYLIAHRPIDEIARSFGVHASRVYEWRQELFRRIGVELRAKTPTDLVAKQIAEMEKVKATAWQGLHRTGDHAEKNGYLRTIIFTEKSIADLYARVGLISVTTMAPAVDIDMQDEDGKAGMLHKMAKKFLQIDDKKKVEKTVKKTTEQPLDDGDYLL